MDINYMDQFKTPEDFIRCEILTNRGNRNVIDKAELKSFARRNGIEINDKMLKEEIYDLLIQKISPQDLQSYCNIGVHSKSMQLKFDISHQEVKRMARLGFIGITGHYPFRAYGKYRYADLYDVYDYFKLTKEKVHQWLIENPKGTRSFRASLERKSEVKIFET